MRRYVLACLVLSALLTATAQAKNIFRLTDINPGPAGSYPSYMAVYDDALYFRANDLPHGNNVELWRHDGTSAGLAAEIMPGPTGSDPAYLTPSGPYLYFAAAGPAGSGMYRYDGAAVSLAPGWSGTFPQQLTDYHGSLIYNQWHNAQDTELWKYDGGSQAPIYAAGGGRVLNPQSFYEYGGLLYFSAAGPIGGAELWRTNGTAAAQITEILPGGGSSPASFGAYNGALYFSAYDGVHGNELWRYDGARTEMVADIRPGGPYDSGNPHDLVAYDGKLYFSADDGVHGCELWAYDGTTARMVAEINPTPNPNNGDDWMMDSNPTHMVVYEGKLYFVANDGYDNHGDEVWSWDGTKAELEFDIYPGRYGSNITEMVLYGDSVYLDADDGANGRELWRMTMPEPATLALLALGALGLLARRRARAAPVGR
jgi:ELWxxDGT repeat protein